MYMKATHLLKIHYDHSNLNTAFESHTTQQLTPNSRVVQLHQHSAVHSGYQCQFTYLYFPLIMICYEET